MKVINAIRRAFAREAEAKAKHAHRRGFDWAAGELLRGRDPESIEATCNWMPPRQFDEGALDAIRKFEAIRKFDPVSTAPECCVCGIKNGLHKDGWYGYRCNSDDCSPF